MSKKPPTAAEQRHLDRVANLGCIVCGSPAEIHHPRFAGCAGKRSGHYLAIPLCPDHHRNGGPFMAIHAGEKSFENLFGSEEALLDKTIERLVAT